MVNVAKVVNAITDILKIVAFKKGKMLINYPAQNKS